MDEMTAKMDSVKKEHEKQLTTLQEENLNLKQRLQVRFYHKKMPDPDGNKDNTGTATCLNRINSVFLY